MLGFLTAYILGVPVAWSHMTLLAVHFPEMLDQPYHKHTQVTLVALWPIFSVLVLLSTLFEEI